MMLPITLTSDYGTLDYRVAAIKGSLYSNLPDCRTIDITHDIRAFNLLQTAYIIRSAYGYYPKGTIHIIFVDSFFHKSRKNLIAKVDGHYFILADNGLLGLIFYDIKPEEVYEIMVGHRFDDHVNFTATDIFVPSAVHLAKGGIPEIVGKKISEIKEHIMPRAIFKSSEKMIVGEIIYIDNFGNAITNISKAFFEKISKVFKSFNLIFRNFILSKINSRYTDVVLEWENEQQYHGNTSAIFNERGFLEIMVYKGNSGNGASSLLGLKVGERIFIEFLND